MYIRINRYSIPNKDQSWPAESQVLKELMETYTQQGKLLERVVKQIDPYTTEITWIWDSKESFSAFINDPIHKVRENQVKSFTTIELISEEEI